MSRYAYDPELQRGRIQRSLERLRKMRELDMPILPRRIEQLMLWTMRQQRKYGQYVPTQKIPGWRANYQAFVLIHIADENRPPH